MSRILILYGTSDGHTAKIAHVLADTLRSCGSLVGVSDAAREHPLGAADVLSKPFDIHELERVIERACGDAH